VLHGSASFLDRYPEVWSNERKLASGLDSYINL
jgi:hypothetical protein